MSAHAVLAPSAASRWFACPGSLELSKGLESQSSPWADWGTEAHEWAAKFLTNALASQGYWPDTVGDDEMRDMVTGYVEFCVSVYMELSKRVESKIRWYVEHKVKYSENVWGTGDTIFAFKSGGLDFMVVIDLKTGAGVPVPIEKSDQLKVYAVSARRTLKIDPEEVCFWIYQPRVYEEPQKLVLSREELNKFEGLLVEKEQKALYVMENGAQPSDFKAGTHCRFCPAWHKCSYFKEQVVEEATIDVTELDVYLPELRTIPEKQLVKIWRHKGMIEKWLSAIENHLLMNAMNRRVAGLKVVLSRSQRRWKDDAEKVAAGLKKLGIKEPFIKKLIGIGEAERKTKKDFEHLVQMTKPKAQLTVEDDLRPEVRELRKTRTLEGITELEVKNGRSKTSKGARLKQTKKSTLRGDKKKVKRKS